MLRCCFFKTFALLAGMVGTSNKTHGKYLLIYAMEGPICKINKRCSLGIMTMTLLWNIYANE